MARQGGASRRPKVAKPSEKLAANHGAAKDDKPARRRAHARAHGSQRAVPQTEDEEDRSGKREVDDFRGAPPSEADERADCEPATTRPLAERGISDAHDLEQNEKPRTAPPRGSRTRAWQFQSDDSHQNPGEDGGRRAPAPAEEPASDTPDTTTAIRERRAGARVRVNADWPVTANTPATTYGSTPP